MSAVLMEEAGAPNVVARPTPKVGSPRRSKGFDRPRWLYVVNAAVLLLMLAPLAVVVVFSFNSRRSLVLMGGFSTRWYRAAFSSSEVLTSLRISVVVAAATTVLSAVLGTLLALCLKRGNRAVARGSNALLIGRLVTPETVTAVALFVLITQLGVTLSQWTIIAGHVGLCLPYVAVVVRSRLDSLNLEVEDAAMDLGATRIGALRSVVLPLLWPSIAAASMLTFVISFDDFVTTFYNSGTGAAPLPLYIYGMLRFGVTPVVNAIGIVMIVVTALAAGAAVALMRLARRQTSPSAIEGSL
jgi:ABC-type spermidine/putrescine transport system permease subunit II